MKKRDLGVYLILAIVWGGFAVWQWIDHNRTETRMRQGFVDRTREIANSVGVVIRSQRHFNIVRRPRLAAAMEELANNEGILSVALYTSGGDEVTTAGLQLMISPGPLAPGGVQWEEDRLIVVHAVDLGVNSALEEEERIPRPPHDRDWDRMEQEERAERGEGRERDDRRRRSSFRRFLEEGERPPWMNEEQFRSFLRLDGPHFLALNINASGLSRFIRRDVWFRIAMCGLALLAVAGVAAAWRAGARSSQFELRLARAREMNAGLREMNLAAAGLAHETRNPLNIVRGIAQLIANDQNVPDEARGRARDIVGEVDRVASRLSEFIDYAKPREPKMKAVQTRALVEEVRGALDFDLDDKRVEFSIEGPELAVRGDESLMRQALFNLILNASQAVDEGGRVQVALVPVNGRVWIEVRDSGSGVEPDRREEIFRPYVTSRAEGTGLGLAVVRQIVRAHGWDIECDDGEDGMFLFRIRNIDPA